jgi:hypothetical protein
MFNELLAANTSTILKEPEHAPGRTRISTDYPNEAQKEIVW